MIILNVGETGLVVTRASCYSCVFSKTRILQEFSVISDEKKIQTNSGTRNLEIIYGNKKKLWAIFFFFFFLPLWVIFLHFRKFTLR